MNDKYDLLVNYQDQRIKISGVFDRMSTVTQQFREIKTVLLQDVYAHVDGKDIDIGHTWLQHAESLKAFDLISGDRIECSCRVKPRKKRLPYPNKDGLMFENGLSLCWPNEVVVVSRSKSSEIVPNPPLFESLEITPPTPIVEEFQVVETPVPSNPAKVIWDIRRLAKEVGGFDSLQELVEALRTDV